MWEMGALVLLVVENLPESRSAFAGLPTMDDMKQANARNIMHLIGRVMVCSIIWRMFPWNLDPARMVLVVPTIALVACVLVGFKTKLSAIGVILMFTVYSVCYNFYFWFTYQEATFYMLSHLVFQWTSALGGIVFVVALGPGEYSIDARKKE